MKKLDKNIALLEDYLEWQKLHNMDGTGIDEATKNLIDAAKKYQKIQEVLERVWNIPSHLINKEECLDRIMETYREVR